ncbi:MAG: hypothetical protein ONB17_01545 [candidate division KSB1 bacterium]|nr:hypothetical protein [candidate division KSB1 bacterium]
MRNATPVVLFLALVVLFAGLYFGCDKGEPTKPEPKVEFPVKMSGGDPVGVWRADSATIHLVDSSLLAMMQMFGVYAFTHEEKLRGTLTIRQDNSYSAACTLGVQATVWFGTKPDSLVPIVYSGGDTLVSSGVVGRQLPNALIFDFNKTNFRLDTLGYTATANRLHLVTLPSALPFMGTSIAIYFMLYFSK